MSTPRKNHAKTLEILVSGKFDISDTTVYANKAVAWEYDGKTITVTESGESLSDEFVLDEEKAYIKKVNYVHGVEPKGCFSRKVDFNKIAGDTFETLCPNCNENIVVTKSSANMVHCELCGVGFPLSRGRIYGEQKAKKTFVPKERFDHDDVDYNQKLAEKRKAGLK